MSLSEHLNREAIKCWNKDKLDINNWMNNFMESGQVKKKLRRKNRH